MALASLTLIRQLVFVQLFLSHVVFAVPSWHYLASQIRDVKDIKHTYDYIIVGGGTAGLTIGDRLTKSGRCLHNPIPKFQPQSS